MMKDSPVSVTRGRALADTDIGETGLPPRLGPLQ
jgi:hypothetical protein